MQRGGGFQRGQRVITAMRGQQLLLKVMEEESTPLPPLPQEWYRRARERVCLRSALLVLGDFREILEDFPEESVDLIFTDPPYDRKSVPLYTELARVAARVLKPGGSLLAYAGHYALPEILPSMGQYLRYWWLLGVRHQNNYTSLSGKKVYVTWKPIIWFVKGTYGLDEFVFDSFQSKTPDKTYHQWAQSVEEALYYIGKLCPPDGLVVDPFMGSGTTLLAAQRLGRRAVGIEVNPSAFARAQERLASEVK